MWNANSLIQDLNSAKSISYDDNYYATRPSIYILHNGK